MFLAEKKLLPLFFIRNLDIQVSVWSHLKVPWDITVGLGASKSSRPSSQGTGPGIGGGWWALTTTMHTNTGAWEAATEAEGTLGVHGGHQLAPRRRMTKQTHPRQAPTYSQRAIEQPWALAFLIDGH